MAMPMPPLEIEERVGAARSISLFLDYDGTLTPLVADPAGACLGDEARQTIEDLSRNGRTAVTIVSGRALAYLRDRIGLPDLIYAGNHGLEIEGGGLCFVEPAAASARDELRVLTGCLERALRTVPGVFIEPKGLTTSVHYRKVAASDTERLERRVREAVDAHHGVFRLGSGKMLWEILPETDWNKGAAVRWILERLGDEGALSVYFGDDRTDEDAFRALPEGLTFRVGCDGETGAQYRVPGPAAVLEFLQWLATR
jgi:trehalose 6-phosphate phosphatase